MAPLQLPAPTAIKVVKVNNGHKEKIQDSDSRLKIVNQRSSVEPVVPILITISGDSIWTRNCRPPPDRLSVPLKDASEVIARDARYEFLAKVVKAC